MFVFPFFFPHVYTLQFGHIAFFPYPTVACVSSFALLYTMCALLRNANKKFNATHSTWNLVCNAAVRVGAAKARRKQSCLCVCVYPHENWKNLFVVTRKITPSSFTFREPLPLERAYAYMRINTDRDTLNGLFSVHVIRCCVWMWMCVCPSILACVFVYVRISMIFYALFGCNVSDASILV